MGGLSCNNCNKNDATVKDEFNMKDDYSRNKKLKKKNETRNYNNNNNANNINTNLTNNYTFSKLDLTLNNEGTISTIPIKEEENFNNKKDKEFDFHTIQKAMTVKKEEVEKEEIENYYTLNLIRKLQRNIRLFINKSKKKDLLLGLNTEQLTFSFTSTNQTKFYNNINYNPNSNTQLNSNLKDKEIKIPKIPTKNEKKNTEVDYASSNGFNSRKIKTESNFHLKPLEFQKNYETYLVINPERNLKQEKELREIKEREREIKENEDGIISYPKISLSTQYKTQPNLKKSIQESKLKS